MTPEDKKIAKCSNCEKYYDNVSASSPLGWCREGYGRAIHTLSMCPKKADQQKNKLERKSAKAEKVKVPAPVAKIKKPKKVNEHAKPLVVTVKQKRQLGTKE